MSKLIVEVCTISEVVNHPNADRLDMVKISGKDWQCITQRDAYKAGDAAIYIPVDSVLDPETESKIFGPDSKVKLENHRVRTIKLRGVTSQGMVVSPDLFGLGKMKVGTDVADVLNITKYEPPLNTPGGPQIQGQARPAHPDFHKYTDIENVKNYPNVLQEGEECVITEKIHGSSFRVATVKAMPRFRFGELLNWFKVWRGKTVTEFHAGSHNMDLRDSTNNIYWRMATAYHLDKIVPLGYELFGEIYGKGVQKLDYDMGAQEVRFFDLMVNGSYVSYDEFTRFCDAHHLLKVPQLYRGPWKRELLAMADGQSVMAAHIREGVVIKPVVERWDHAVGRVVLKGISSEYLLSKNSEEVVAH